MTEPEPIRELTGQEVEPSRDFLGRVRRNIERRSATAHLATFSWQLPRVLLVEFLQLLGDVPSQLNQKRGPRP